MQFGDVEFEDAVLACQPGAICIIDARTMARQNLALHLANEEAQRLSLLLKNEQEFHKTWKQMAKDLLEELQRAKAKIAALLPHEEREYL